MISVVGMVGGETPSRRWLTSMKHRPPNPQPREHPVPCRTCRQPTWNTAAVCDRCHQQRSSQ